MQTDIKARKQVIDYMLEGLGLIHIRSYYENGQMFREYRCENCGIVESATATNICKWRNNKLKHCKSCRGTVKSLSPEVKTAQLNARLFSKEPYSSVVKAVEYLGYNKEKEQAYAIIQFLSCGHLKQYSTTVLGSMVRGGKMFACDECSHNGDAISAMEMVVLNRLSKHGFISQVKYSDIAQCDRKWVADLYSPELNIVVEVTTTSMSTKNMYSDNLQEKIVWGEDNGVEVLIITSLHELEDIVQKCSVKQSQL